MFTVTLAPVPARFAVTQAAKEAICQGSRVLLQTLRHPAAKLVLELRTSVDSMDDLYDGCQDFDALNAAIGERLAQAGDCVYAYTGNIASTQLPAICRAVEARGGRVAALPGVSAALAAYPDKPMGAVYPGTLLPEALHPWEPLAVEEIDSALRAGEVKLKLMEYYPDEWEILLADMDGEGLFTVRTLPLYQLDRQTAYTPATALYVPPAPFERRERYGWEELMEVIRRLRAPGGCPWDREQTHLSLKPALMEECYELLDAIDEGDDVHMTEELGDVLMQVAMHSAIAQEQGRFTDRDVSTGIVQKLIYRHPHVFGDVRVSGSGEVLQNWEKLKMAEKELRTQTDVLMSVSRSLPALVRSKKVQKKAANVGFDWTNAQEALPKISEELEELRQAMATGQGIDEEMGDLLFSVVNVSRLLHQDPEFLLLAATDKFTARFAAMEELALAQGKRLEEMTFDQQNELWEKVKNARKRA